MSDHQFLIVRALRATDSPSKGEIPLAPSGFTRLEAAAMGVFRGEQLVWAAPYSPAELRALGQVIARAAVLGAPRLIDESQGDGDLLDRCYRALLDHFFADAGATNVVVIELRDGQRHHVDVLWRLAVALNSRLIISDTPDGVRLELFAHGRRAELAAAIASRPHALIKTLVNDMRGLFRDRRAPKHQTLAILIRDVTEPLTLVAPGVPVEYAEVSDEEVRRRPRRFGVGLVAAAGGLDHRHQFVGCLDDRPVFHIACHSSAPALDLLPPNVRSRLAEPIALLTEAHTAAEFRNRSIFAAGLQWSIGWATQRGIRTLAMLVLIDNTPSLRGAAKAGFRRVGELTIPR